MELSIPVGTTIAVTVALTAALTAGAFIAGRSSAPSDVEQVTGLVVAQGVQLDIVLDGMSDLAGRVGRPITIDAETRASLAEIPPQCVALLGGDPMSLSCALFSCIQYGQSTANRPECSAIQAAYITSLRLEQPAP